MVLVRIFGHAMPIRLSQRHGKPALISHIRTCHVSIWAWHSGSIEELRRAAPLLQCSTSIVAQHMYCGGDDYGDLFPTFYRMHAFLYSFEASSETIYGLDIHFGKFWKFEIVYRQKSSQNHQKLNFVVKQLVVRRLNSAKLVSSYAMWVKQLNCFEYFTDIKK